MDTARGPTAGTLLRVARRSSRLTQQELADRAGVAQSVISAYESGHREPALSTLVRLVAATGNDLKLGLERHTSAELGLPDTRLGRRLRRHRSAVRECAARYGVGSVRVFGSVARGEDEGTSDIDLVVEVPPSTGLFALGQLEHELEELLGAKVDLVTSDGLRPDVRAEVDRDAISL
ncbi:MAG: nucleotidyltransferase domain-containing protein [Acidimicrobiales bacterium]